MIPDDVVEEVRARADIVEVIGEHVTLKKAGKDFKGSCPFHDERTPSFFVVPAKGFYNCFGCGQSGDVFSFLMNKMGLDFVEAVKEVGRRSGVGVREVGGGEGEDPYRAHHEANAFARDFFRTVLAGEDGSEARRYLEERGVGAETVEKFGLGYAPDEWRALRESAAQHGISDALLLEVGLLTTSERSQEPYDRFRNRIIFPIESTSGKVVAFGGRVLGVGGVGVPKYLNSPETPVYQKGEILYGLSRARHPIRRDDATALLVEGYTDVVSLAAAGVENAVATLGTALTSGQARLLGRYARRALLLFDSDAAGLRATFRSGDILLREGVHPSVVTLPPGEDPDSLVRKDGAAGLRRHLGEAVDLLDRKLQILDERDHFSSIEKTRRAVDRLLPTLRAARDSTLRDLYVAKVSERTGVRRETLEEEMARDAPPVARSLPRETERVSPGRIRGRSGPVLPPMGPERKLVQLLLRTGEWVERAAERVGPEDFEDPVYRTIFCALVEDPDLRSAPEGMDAAAARRLEELLEDPEELLHAGRVFEGSVAQIRGRSLDRRYEKLKRRIEGARDEEERRALVVEKARLRRERNEIGLDWSSTARWSPTREHRDHP